MRNWSKSAVAALGFVALAGALASAGTFSESPLVLTDAAAADASTGVSTSKIYTHLVDLASDDGGASINGVTFPAGLETGPDYALGGGTFTNFQGNGPGYGNDLPPASGIYDLTEDFYYGPDVQTLTLTGLTGGQSYIASFYTAGFAGAQVTLNADDDGTLNQFTTDRGDEKVIRYAYTQAAGDTNIVFTFDSVDNSNGFHHYGFSNEVVPEPAAISLLGIGALGLLARRRRA